VAARVAAVRGTDLAGVVSATGANARRVFGPRVAAP